MKLSTARALAVAALTLARPSIASGYQVRTVTHHTVVRPASLPHLETSTRGTERAAEPTTLRAPDPAASATPTAAHAGRRLRHAAPLPFHFFDPLHWHRMALLGQPQRV